jgi:two-component system, OmpR family, sensor histidine kinase KdpD
MCPRRRTAPSRSFSGRATLIVAIATALAWALFPFVQPSTLVMVYLLGVVLVATRLGRGPSILASVLSVAAFDFFFVPRYFSFAVADTEYLVTFAVMLVIALVISTLALRVRQEADQARWRDRRTAALYAMARDLARAASADEVLAAAVRHVGEVLDSACAVLLPEDGGGLVVRAGNVGVDTDASERAVARWAYEHGQPAGLGSSTLPGARALYLPLRAPRGTAGVLAVRPPTPVALADPEQLHPPGGVRRANGRRGGARPSRPRGTARDGPGRIGAAGNALLSAVSHDLRTLLATITGATSTLLDSEDRLESTHAAGTVVSCA